MEVNGEAKPVTLEKTVTIVEPETAARINGDGSISSEGAAADTNVTPKKKSGRRRVRGKKKPKDQNGSQQASAEDDDLGGDSDKGEAGPDSSGSSPPGTIARRDEKPLPELPTMMTVPDIMDTNDKDKLFVSSDAIGESFD